MKRAVRPKADRVRNPGPISQAARIPDYATARLRRARVSIRATPVARAEQSFFARVHLAVTLVRYTNSNAGKV